MTNEIKKGLFSIIVLFMFVFSSNFVLADFKKPDKNFGADDVKYGKEKNSDITGVIVTIAEWLLGFVGALSVLIIIIGGILYIISGGDAGKTDAAKGWVLAAVVGLIVALLGWVIVNSVISGLEGTKSDKPNNESSAEEE